MTIEALLLCIKENNVEAFKKIVVHLTEEQKISLSIQKICHPVTKLESTILMYVVINNQVKILHELLKIDAVKVHVMKNEYLNFYDMNIGANALSWAAEKQQIAVINELLKSDPNTLDAKCLWVQQQFANTKQPIYLMMSDILWEMKCEFVELNEKTWKNCFHHWLMFRRCNNESIKHLKNKLIPDSSQPNLRIST